MKKSNLLLFLGILTLTSCRPLLEVGFVTVTDVQREAETAAAAEPSKNASNLCKDAALYVPDTAHLEFTPYRYVRVNFHFMNATDSSKNFVGSEAERFAKNLLGYMNRELVHNQKMWLPKGNTTPVLPVRFEFVLTPDPKRPNDTGVYCHFDNELYFFVQRGRHQNLAKREVIARYAVQPDTVLNIFVMPHHPDSVASPTYPLTQTGIALGNAVKVAGLFESGKEVWNFKGLLNHEIGHVLGLGHTWGGNDGCDDTPKNPNCWNIGDTPPCDREASNNVMDYNSQQNAWTPCQLGLVHRNFAQLGASQRKILRPTWCNLDENRPITIRDSIFWQTQKDLEGNLIIEKGGFLEVSCRLSMPEGGKIIVRPGGTLLIRPTARLHNACGGLWQGIEIQKQGKATGRVVVRGEPVLENMLNSF